MKKVLIVGTGWTGASVSHKLESLGVKTTLVEKENKVGGHSKSDLKNGIIYEPNGPHIFHTSNHAVNQFVSKFGMTRKFKHKVKSRIYPDSMKGESLLVSWPPQIDELKKLKEWRKIESEINSLPKQPNNNNFETYAVSIMGMTLYQLFIYGYTKKQWDLEPFELSSTFAPKRIDLRSDNNKRLFNDKWEYFHPEGSGEIIKKILEKKEIIFNKNVNLDNLSEFILNYDALVITASLDDFSLSKEKLLWRGIKSKPKYFASVGVDQYVTEAYQINHPSLNEKFTRTVETKHASGQRIKGSIVCEEFSVPNLKHYPVLVKDEYFKKLNNKFKKIINSEVNIPTFFSGRLANYSYINQDQAIEMGFKCAEKVYKEIE